MKLFSGSLQHHTDGRWTFRSEDNQGVYYTNTSGEGLFWQSTRTGETKQFLGTCQFSACKTSSGMYKKCNRFLAEMEEDPT